MLSMDQTFVTSIQVLSMSQTSVARVEVVHMDKMSMIRIQAIHMDQTSVKIHVIFMEQTSGIRIYPRMFFRIFSLNVH